MKLDKYDWKILGVLDRNSRQSDAKIGRQVRLSKQVVNHRILRLWEAGIITSFFAHVNVAKLGFAVHKVYVRYTRLSEEKDKEIWTFLTGRKEVIWTVTCSGIYDLIFGIASRTIEEFEACVSAFTDRFSEQIAHRDIAVFQRAILLHRKWLVLDNKGEEWLLGGPMEHHTLDPLDTMILQSLAKDARTPLTAMATKGKTSSPRILQRIRKMEERGIIGAYRLGLDRDALCIQYCKAFVYYDHKTTQKERMLIAHCASLPETVGISQSIGPWDLELEFEIREFREYQKIMKLLKNAHAIIRNYETCTIEKESGLSFFPRMAST